MAFYTADPLKLSGNAIDRIANEWMLVAAGDKQRYNMMTASWGFFGEMWGKHVAGIVLRPQRFTKQFVDQKSHFSLSFFGTDERARALHKICGSQSGRDIDKAAATGLTPVCDVVRDTVYFAEAPLVLICRKLYAAPFDPAAFADQALRDAVYPDGDWHTQYFGEIVEVLEQG